ncbi:MAG: 50S ribosome-binding GTPase [Erysipelotrichaceae bacterium]|nr:50S ribosome-binding GTPase [Erysipelotrichaceae bacterium]
MMEEKYCKGCGIRLQNEDPEKEGYVVREDMEYCQRCFKMRHYNQHNQFEKKITEDDVFDLLNKQEGEFVWIIDAFDCQSALNSRFSEFYAGRDFILIINKLDLFPEEIKREKIVSSILYSLENKGLKPLETFSRGDNPYFREDFISYFKSHGKNLIFTGLANSGKSTVINDLLRQQLLTVNRNPATTLNVNRIEFEGGHLIDTVGLKLDSCLVSHLTDKQLRTVVPVNPLRPQVYQLYGDQSLIIGGLVRIDVFDAEDFSAVNYISNLLKVHRGMQENAEKNFANKNLVPKLKKSEKLKMVRINYHKEKRDICISGLGFVTVSGKYSHIDVYIDQRISVFARKAMI